MIQGCYQTIEGLPPAPGTQSKIANNDVKWLVVYALLLDTLIGLAAGCPKVESRPYMESSN